MAWERRKSRPNGPRRFTDSGIQWRIFLPLGHLGVFIPSHWRRLHRKLCVIDAEVAFCGGVNVLDDFSDPNFGPLSEPRLDFTVRVTGPLVQDALEATTRFWWRMTVAAEVRDHELPAPGRSCRNGCDRRIPERASKPGADEAQPSRGPAVGRPGGQGRPGAARQPAQSAPDRACLPAGRSATRAAR